jgi:hypothetical protein
VISEDLRPQESLFQMFNALEELEHVAISVFNRISERVGSRFDYVVNLDFVTHEGQSLLFQLYRFAFNNVIIMVCARRQVIEERDRLVGINNRLNVAESKVKSLVGSRHATSIFSPCVKYLTYSVSVSHLVCLTRYAS